MAEQEQQEMSDEEAIQKIVLAMKDNAPTQDEKNNVHTFLTNVVHAEDVDKVSKIANLRNDSELDELGTPSWNVRGSMEMGLISSHIIENETLQLIYHTIRYIISTGPYFDTVGNKMAYCSE